MKTSIFFGALLGLLFITSCDRGREAYARWEIVNSSKYSIVIRTFHKGQASEAITLAQEGSIWQSENYSDHPLGGNFPPIATSLEADSLTITFGNERIAKYNFGHFNHNPLQEANYLIIKESHRKFMQYIHRFTFTKEDYENAEEIVD